MPYTNNENFSTLSDNKDELNIFEPNIPRNFVHIDQLHENGYVIPSYIKNDRNLLIWTKSKMKYIIFIFSKASSMMLCMWVLSLKTQIYDRIVF
jgi:hypothetical protein